MHQLFFCCFDRFGVVFIYFLDAFDIEVLVQVEVEEGLAAEERDFERFIVLLQFQFVYSESLLEDSRVRRFLFLAERSPIRGYSFRDHPERLIFQLFFHLFVVLLEIDLVRSDWFDWSLVVLLVE